MQDSAYSSSWTFRLLQVGHRASILAVVLLVATVFAALKSKPADVAAWGTILAADVAIVLSGLLVIRAYRTARPVREIVGLLLFSLAIAHAAGYLLLTQFHCLTPLRDFLVAQRIL